MRRLVRNVTVVAAASLLVVAFGPTPAFAAVASQQWLTAVSSGSGGVGTSIALTFGTSGVTAAQKETAVTGTCGVLGQGAILSGTNVSTFIMPAPPVGSVSESNQCNSNSDYQSTVTFNKPLIAPIVHEINLDGSELIIGGTSTSSAAIALSPISANTAAGPSGNTINPVFAGVNNFGCETDAGANPFGACGSFALTSATGQIKSFTVENQSIGGNDGWFLSFSFPSAAVTPSFAVATIAPGATTQLTFTIANPSGPGSAALAPLDFTNILPSGVTIADGTKSNNGNCGSPAVKDAGGGALASGDTGIKASGISVAVGATCTITVDVTASTVGAYTDSAPAISSTIGNLIPDGTTTLTVAAGTPLADPLVLAAALVLLAGAALGFRRLRRTAARRRP